MKTIAVIEDDKLLNEALKIMLEKAGYHVVKAESCKEAERLIKDEVSLMVVDIGLPDGEGIELCKKAREFSEIPVIFLTARDEEEDMLRAFDYGADDYLVKPFPMQVLRKHIEAVLRRSDSDNSVFSYRGLRIEYERMQVSYEGKPVKLSAREYKLLELLAKNKNKIVTKRMMLEQVWDAEGNFVEENTVNVTLNRLKKKIEPNPSEPVFIKNVFGLGYILGE